MEELLHIIVSALVEDDESFTITGKEDANGVSLQLCVREDKMGRVIGRQGRVARAIRTVVRSAAADGRRVSLNIENL